MSMKSSSGTIGMFRTCGNYARRENSEENVQDYPRGKNFI
jgi:hypothetical protein